MNAASLLLKCISDGCWNHGPRNAQLLSQASFAHVHYCKACRGEPFAGRAAPAAAPVPRQLFGQAVN